MTSLITSHVSRSAATADAVLVHGPSGLELAGLRLRDRVAARVWATSLDRRLASGEAVESDIVLAARAAYLCRLRTRRGIARGWEQLADRALNPSRAVDPRVPVARRGVARAVEQIFGVADRLRDTRPASAAGIASARLLLTDAAHSPVYDLHGAAEDVAAAVARSLDSM